MLFFDLASLPNNLEALADLYYPAVSARIDVAQRLHAHVGRRALLEDVALHAFLELRHKLGVEGHAVDLGGVGLGRFAPGVLEMSLAEVWLDLVEQNQPTAL